MNYMFTNSIFPDTLKAPKVIQIYIKSDRNILFNYRPISLLTSFSKIFQNIIHRQLYEYLQKGTL